MIAKKYARGVLRRFGYDVVTHRSVSSLGSNISYIIDQKGIQLVIDVGGHYGEYGQYLRELGFKGWIYSFEPIETNFLELRKRSDRDSKWIVRRAALGNSNDRKPINVMSGTVLSSFHLPSKWGEAEYGAGLEISRVESVDVFRLSDIFEEVVGVQSDAGIMLKIDTQGFEFDVLQGAEECLSRIAVVQAELPIISLYEDSAANEQVVQHLKERGLHLSGCWPVAHDRDLRLIEMDCLFVRAAGSTA